MKNKLEELDPKLEQLLLEKNYDQLTKAEQAYVQTYLSPEAYASFRTLLVGTKTIFEEPLGTPDPAIRTNLLQQLKANQPAKPSFFDRFKHLLNYPVPSWQVAIACMVVTTSFHFFTLQQNPSTPFDVHPVSIQGDSLSNNSQPVGADKELLNLLTGV